MSRQMPEMYIRGALANLMENLTHKQQTEVEERLCELIDNPKLEKCKNAFCRALSNTIKSDYVEYEVAFNDYMIALFRGIVYILYYKPNKEIFDDPIQTSKFFKTFVFQYLRQILNENKIPFTDVTETYNGLAHNVANRHICHILSENNIEFTSEMINENEHLIVGNIGIIDMKTAKKLGSLITSYHKMGVEMKINKDMILISGHNPTNMEITLKRKSKLKTSALDVMIDDESMKYQIEYDILRSPKNEQTKPEDLHEFRMMLPQKIVEIYDLITNTPDDFIKEYGEMVSKNTMSRYLNVSINEINDRMTALKHHYIIYRS